MSPISLYNLALSFDVRGKRQQTQYIKSDFSQQQPSQVVVNAQVKKTAPPPEPRISVLKSQVESKSSSPPAPADNIAKKDVDEIIDFIEGNKNISHALVSGVSLILLQQIE